MNDTSSSTMKKNNIMNKNDSNDMNMNDSNDMNMNDSNDCSIESGLEILFQFKLNQSNQCTSAISIIRESAIFPENVSYSLKRLVRGLSSSRDGARLGFATALKELLSLLPELPVGLFLYHLHQTSESNGKKSGQEEREFYFARIFGYYAMALSGMLTSVPSAPFMTSLTQERNFTATIDEINSMVENLLECCKQKDYLKVSATFCALQILNALQSHPTDAATLSDAIIKKWLENGISTPEHVWFALEAQRIHPSCSAWSTLLADWKKTDILYSKNKSKLLEILKSASFYHENQEFMASPIQNEKQVSFSSLHPIFQALVDGMQNPPPSSSCRMNLFEFWGLIEPFFFASHSHDRKSMGFLFLTQLVVPCCQPNQISLVFTKLFMRCLINSLSSSDTKLNKQARFTTSVLTLQAQQSPSLALPLLGQLIGVNGHFKFDQITRTKTVESLLGILSEQDVEHHFLFLNRVFQNPLLLVPQQQQQENQEEEEKIDKQVPGANPNFDTIRLWVVDQIYLVLKTPKIKKSKRIVEKSIEWLVSTAFSEWKGMESTSNTNGCELVRKSCREKIVTSLSYLSHLTFSKEEENEDGEKTGKEGHEMKPGYYTPTQTWLSLIHSLLMKSKTNSKKNKDSALLLKSSESIHRMIDEKTNVTVSSLLSISELDCFQKVFETLGIVFYCDSDVDEQSEEKGVQIITELDQCVSNMITPPFLPKRKRKQDGVEKGDSEGTIESIQAVEVLVDLLISFLARPSMVLRSLSVDVFKTFAKKTATRSVLDLFIEVLSVHGGVQGAQELFEEDGLESGVENQESSSDDDEEEDDDDVEGEEETENAMPVDEELRAKIQAALEMDVEQDLEDLGDDEMEAFDSKLAEIFSQRKSIKNAKKESKETVLHFKLRVLDLFDLFLKSNASSPLFISAIEPVLKLYQSASQSSDSALLHKKLGSIIKSRMVHSKDVIPFDVDSRKECLEVVQKLLSVCRKWNDAEGMMSGIALTLVKQLVHPSNQVTLSTATEEQPPKKKKKEKKKGKEESSCEVLFMNVEKEICAIYTATFTHWMTIKNSKIRPSVFLDFSTRYPLLALELVPEMLKATDPSLEAKSFQVVKTFEMTALFLKNVSKVSSHEVKIQVIQLARQYTSHLCTVLEKAGDVGDKGPFGMPKDRIKTLLKSLGMVIRKVKLIQETSEIWTNDSLKNVLENISKHERFKCAAVTSLVKQTLLLLIK